MVDTPLMLVPQPRHLSLTDDIFMLDAATTLAVPATSSPGMLFAARQLQAAVQDATGLLLPIQPGHQGTRNVVRLMSRADESLQIRDPASSAIDDQSYTLRIDPGMIDIGGTGAAGLFYGVQTVIQMITVQGRYLRSCHCEDQPALAHRGIMLDVSRGKVPRLSTLRQLVDRMAHYKLNQLQLYTEHTFRFPSHPSIGADCGSLSADDMLALDMYCRERFITLVPNLQSTGHLRHLLSLPEYEHLAETGWRWSITPAREESYELLAQLYADFLPAFSAPVLNVNSDEAWDFGRGQAQDLSAQKGFGRVYLDHLLRLREIAARHGRRIMVWADVLHHHPELIREIPDDMVLLDWEYEARPSYPTLQALAAAGRPFYVCPGTSSWNTIFPRIDNARNNTRTYVRDGIAAGAIGMLLTDWGDMGHYQPLSNSWYGYVWGAEMAWTGGNTRTEDFDAAFGTQCLRDPSGAAVAAIRRLARAVEQPSLAQHNRSDSVYALYDEPLTGRMIASADPGDLAELRDAGQAALAAFAFLSDVTLRHELMFSAHQLVFAARKVLLSQQIRDTLSALATGSADTRLKQIDEHVAELHAIRAALPAMRAELEQIWLRAAHRSEIALNLERYLRLEARLDFALDWLRRQRDMAATAGTIDAELRSYDPGPYRILWDAANDNLRQLIAIVGADKVPPEVREWAEGSATPS